MLVLDVLNTDCWYKKYSTFSCKFLNNLSRKSDFSSKTTKFSIDFPLGKFDTNIRETLTQGLQDLKSSYQTKSIFRLSRCYVHISLDFTCTFVDILL